MGTATLSLTVGDFNNWGRVLLLQLSADKALSLEGFVVGALLSYGGASRLSDDSEEVTMDGVDSIMELERPGEEKKKR